jgi:hypothetical protein
MNVTFDNKYVAFLDVLGFSELVAAQKKEKLEKYFETVQQSFTIFSKKKKTLAKYMISDSVILIAENTEDDLRSLLTAIRTLQSKLAFEDIWLRGGISFGEVYHNEELNLIVGNGYITAFNLERLADVPRVIIDPSILSKLNLDRLQFYEKFNGTSIEGYLHANLVHDYGRQGGKSFLLEDAIFVCYADQLIRGEMINSVNGWTEGFDLVYTALRKNLYGDQRHYRKYIWLKNYFSEVLWSLYNLHHIEGGEEDHFLNKQLSRFDAL